MTKKFLIVVICLVTVCAVLNLNDKLTYTEPAIDENGKEYTRTGFEIAAGMISADASQVVDDMAYLQVIAFVAERYGEMDDGRLIVTTGATDDGGAYIRLGYVNHSGTGIAKSFEVASLEVAEKIDAMLVGFQYGIPAVPEGEPFSEVIDATNTILHFFGFIYSAAVFLLQIIFDVFAVAFSVVEAAFYLLGF